MFAITSNEFWWIVFLSLAGIGYAMHRAVSGVASAAGKTWNAVNNSPVAGSAAKVGASYFLHRFFK